MTWLGKPVKASRLFGGNEHEQQVKRIADFFHQSIVRYKTIEFNEKIINALEKKDIPEQHLNTQLMLKSSLFAKREISNFRNDKEAYHQLVRDIVSQQYVSTQLVLKETPVKTIFVDGGFSYNKVYMKLLASAFPNFKVYAASMAQATAIGAALSIHHSWNTKPIPDKLVDLQPVPG
jgi:activator of 2-hydroxyglutaryl-CoA dehydratase